MAFLLGSMTWPNLEKRCDTHVVGVPISRPQRNMPRGYVIVLACRGLITALDRARDGRGSCWDTALSPWHEAVIKLAIGPRWRDEHRPRQVPGQRSALPRGHPPSPEEWGGDERRESEWVEAPPERLSPRFSVHQERLRLFGQRRPVLASCPVSLRVGLGLRQRVLPLPGLPTGLVSTTTKRPPTVTLTVSPSSKRRRAVAAR